MVRPIADRYPTALVTGAADGLGRAIALRLAAEGVRVWASSRSAERLAPLVSAGRGRIAPVVLDLEKPDDAERAFAAAAAESGGAFALLVNNAGYGLFGEFGEIPFAAWEAQLGAMIGTTLRITRLAWLGWGPDRPGCLVNISSLAAEFPLPYMSGYNVAKAGLSALSQSLMFESGGRGVTVVDFRPGDYRTDFNRAMNRRSAPPPAGPAAGVWRRLEANLRAAPPPERAAEDLVRALRSGRSGVVRSGSCFQAVIAPAGARLLPLGLLRRILAGYFGLS